jgi:thiamine pyrophosphate-dependent acetolactate synthase large subunit-like protein
MCVNDLTPIQTHCPLEAAGIPFYTTPQGRGAIPEDHAHSYPTARAGAFRDADLIVVVGTRMNYVIGHAAPPRWNAAAKIVRIDIDPSEIANSPRRLDIGVVADAKAAFQQLTNAIKGKVTPAHYETWRERLRIRNVQKMAEAEQQLSTSQSPIHPLRLCKEIRDFMDRDCILCRRPGDPQLRPPGDPTVHGAAPHQFGRIRNHGRRHAFRCRRSQRPAGRRHTQLGPNPVLAAR